MRKKVDQMAPVNDKAEPMAACPEDLSSIIAQSVLDKSGAISCPFKVSFDPACSFCRKNRQIYLVNEEYEHPEPTFIKRMPASVAALSYEQTYPGRSVVILRDHETDVNYVLKNKLLLYIAFMEDVSAVVDAITATCNPDKINYAIYMNQNDHLHIHLIPRYKSEGPKFPEPPTFYAKNALDPDFNYRSLALKIRKNLKQKKSPISKYVETLINHGLP
jgi:diadenosine tetraphosphate (Ap4A) HIT family hydrolase